MPGFGTGFNEKIKTRLFSFLGACYEGLQEEVASGLDPKVGINREFTEIKQYIGLTHEDLGDNPLIIERLALFLESCYQCMLNNLKDDDLKKAIEIKIKDLEVYIDAIEKRHKSKYGSLWK